MESKNKKVVELVPSDIDHALKNLLAIIHCDGGHYTAEHGLLKAIEDAEKKVHNMKNILAQHS
jgi:hypothetical protein